MSASGLSADELAAADVTSLVARRCALTATETPIAIEDVLALSPLQQGLYSLATLTDSENGVDPYVIAMAADISGRGRCGAASPLRGSDVGAPSQPARQLRLRESGR